MRYPILMLVLSLSLPALPKQPDWQRFAPADSSFVVWFPETPEQSFQLMPSPRGLLTTRTAGSADTAGGSFLVSWTDYPPGAFDSPPAERVFAAARDALLASRGDTEILERSRPLPDGPGLATVYRSSGGRIVEVQFRWARGRFYQLMAETPDRPDARAAAARFLHSFAPQPRRAI